jgi:RimJ/RimL family protein N-acetyltransferase
LFSEARLTDGTQALIWPLLAGDREALREGYEHLSQQARTRRFLSNVPHLTDAMLDTLVDAVDGIDHVALSLVALDEDNVGTPVGVARMIRYAEHRSDADVAVTVLDDWQGRGVATALLAELVRVRPEGVSRIVTTVAADNAASLAMLRRLGPTTVTPAGIDRLDVVVGLPSPPARPRSDHDPATAAPQPCPAARPGPVGRPSVP